MKRWGDILSGTGVVIASLLSCAFCPFCLPFYAGFLGVMGVKLGSIQEFFIPSIIAFSLLTLGFMGYQTYTHQGKWTPFKLGLGSAMSMVTFAFFDLDLLLYFSLTLFMGSIMWNKKILVHTRPGCC